MNGRVWLNYFMKACRGLEDRSDCEGEQWTEFMGQVLDEAGKKMRCDVIRSRLEPSKKNQDSNEYLNLDAFFIDRRAYDFYQYDDDYDPFVLPSAIVELENDPDTQKISYCLWKLLCVRSPIRVLICYQKGAETVTTLVHNLENVVWQGSLMKADTSDLILIIGDGSKGDKYEWGDYFTIFEWRNDKFKKMKGLDR